MNQFVCIFSFIESVLTLLHFIVVISISINDNTFIYFFLAVGTNLKFYSIQT